jgi:hypothetical protein
VYGPGGGVLSVLAHVFTSVFSLVAGAVAFLLVLALLVLLVRFLWFGTRAAQVYLAKNGESPRFTWPVKAIDDPQHRDTATDAASAPAAHSPADVSHAGSADDLTADHGTDHTATRPYETPEAPKTPRKPMTPPSAS